MSNLRLRLEDMENELLADCAIKSQFSKGRKYPEKEHPFRTVYQRDRDRIVHSTAFRRLEYKTQVFVNHEGDYYRTRLTHTLEVSQIARSIAKALKLNENLVEAIALAHDLGHTPFGHSGEETLNILMKDYGGFNHNLQGLRVVELLEQRYPDFDGLNLSWEVREGIAKHSTTYDKGSYKWVGDYAKRSVVLSDEIAVEFNVEDLSPELAPSLETQIVDIADEIAYDNHDLDDGLTSGLIKEKDLDHIDMWHEAKNAVNKKYSNLMPKIRRYQIIRYLINLQVTDIINNTLKIIEGRNIKSVDDVRNCKDKIVQFNSDLMQKRVPLRKFLMEEMYQHYRVIRMANKAQRFIKSLFDVYLDKPAQLPPNIKKRLKKDSKEKVVCDYIAGMTDRYALDEYKKLFEPYERV